MANSDGSSFTSTLRETFNIRGRATSPTSSKKASYRSNTSCLPHRCLSMPPPPLNRYPSSASSIGSPTASSLTSSYPSKQNVSTRSGKEWWIVAVAKALQSDNGQKKATNNNNSATKLSSADSKYMEYKNLYQEFSKLKKILDIIKGEYEESKSFEIFRRYNRMKGMVKRTVMYTKLEVLPDVTHALGTGSLVLMTAASMRKPLTIVPECPKAELSERIHTLKQRIAFVRGQIDILADSYENSKQYIIFQRYRLMKAMIKQILTNCIDLRHNYNC